MGRRKEISKTTLRRLHHIEKRSILEMEEILGISRKTIATRMDEHGISRRTATEAGFNMQSKMTKTERLARVANAHKAVRGRKQPLSERINRAKAVEKAQRLSELEKAFRSVFTTERLPLKALVQVQRFNIDFASRRYKLAVEIDGGNWHLPTKKPNRKQLQDRTKTRYLEKRGWTVIRFRASDIGTCVEEIISHLQLLGWNPPSIR